MATNPYLYSQYQGPGVGFGPGPDIVPRAQTQTPAPVASQYVTQAPAPTTTAPPATTPMPTTTSGTGAPSTITPGSPGFTAQGPGSPWSNPGPAPVSNPKDNPPAPGGPTGGSPYPGTAPPTTISDGSGLTGGAGIPGADTPTTPTQPTNPNAPVQRRPFGGAGSPIRFF